MTLLIVVVLVKVTIGLLLSVTLVGLVSPAESIVMLPAPRWTA